MPILFLGLAILIALLLVGRWFLNADPKVAATVVRWLGIGAGALLGLFLLTRMGPAGLIPLGLSTLYLLRRRRGLLGARGFAGFGGATSPTPGQTSEVETATLRMALDHDSGEMQGTVVRGRFEGRSLESMSFDELLQLLAECQANDEQSVNLLETYLDREQGPDWRDHAAAGGAQGGATANAPMTRDEAHEILGLKAGASPEDVKEAHHRLMLKMHPDQGGTTYLASKINQAKDLLLGST